MSQHFKKVTDVEFPEPQGININMMPFIMGDKSSIPKEYQHYHPLVVSCLGYAGEVGKVGYLTISESFVTRNESQRRGGIHVEKHPASSWGGGGWGGRNNGLFMASTVSDSCRVWDEHIETPKPHGDCAHLQNTLGTPTYLKAGELFWITDGTPHEALAVKEDCHRSFFRLVTNEVDLWYEKHSTRNRLGIEPACKIIKENKFS